MQIQDALQRRIEMRIQASEQAQVRIGEVALIRGAVQADESLEEAFAPEIQAGEVAVRLRQHEATEKFRPRDVAIRDDVAHPRERLAGTIRQVLAQRIQFLEQLELLLRFEW